MRTCIACVAVFFRFLFAMLFPRTAVKKLYAEMARLDYVGEWREFRTLQGTRFWVTSSMGGPKIKTLSVPPFFLRPRREGVHAGKLVIEARDGEEWTDFSLTDSRVKEELRVLRELFAFSPCVENPDGNMIPRALPSEKVDE